MGGSEGDLLPDGDRGLDCDFNPVVGEFNPVGDGDAMASLIAGLIVGVAINGVLRLRLAAARKTGGFLLSDVEPLVTLVAVDATLKPSELFTTLAINDVVVGGDTDCCFRNGLVSIAT